VDDDAGDVAGGTLEQVELGAVADLVLVGEGDPREVAEVAALAGGDEADGDGVGPAVALALVAVAVVLGLEGIGGAGEAAAALTDEPARELEGAHAGLGRGFAGVAGGGEAEVTLGGEVEVRIEGLEAGDERAAQAGVVEGLVAVGSEAPVLEAADDDGAVDEVDHGAGAVHADHLALADLAVGALGDDVFDLGFDISASHPGGRSAARCACWARHLASRSGRRIVARRGRRGGRRWRRT
jgi:hypothetical protein